QELHGPACLIRLREAEGTPRWSQMSLVIEPASSLAPSQMDLPESSRRVRHSNGLLSLCIRKEGKHVQQQHHSRVDRFIVVFPSGRNHRENAPEDRGL